MYIVQVSKQNSPFFPSRYLTPGRYRFRVEVSDDEGQAYTPAASWASSAGNLLLAAANVGPDQLIAPCCGSVVHVDDHDREPTGAFRRVGSGPVIHLFSVPDPSVDLMPPGNRTRDFLLFFKKKKKIIFPL